MRVYLATDASGATFKDLGGLKGSKGTQQYAIPAKTNLSPLRHGRLLVRAVLRLARERGPATGLAAQWRSSPVAAGGRDSSASDVIASAPRAASSSTCVASSGERA